MKTLQVYRFVFSNLLMSFFIFLLPVQAGQLSNGQTFFDHPPLLLEASTTYRVHLVSLPEPLLSMD
jgi:hypothetical protein